MTKLELKFEVARENYDDPGRWNKKLRELKRRAAYRFSDTSTLDYGSITYEVHESGTINGISLFSLNAVIVRFEAEVYP
jgi:nitrogen fixation protein FixH